VLEGLSVDVRYQPLLFAGLLKHWGQKGPAEIEPKRAWTFRHVHWIAHQHGIAMQTPAQHPFNPLPAPAPAARLRAGRRHAEPLRLRDGAARCVGARAAMPARPARLTALVAELSPRLDPASEPVKAALKDASTRGIASGVFGVPTIEVDGRLFWGVDGLAMLASYLRSDSWFDGPAWDSEGAPRAGLVRG